MSPAAIVLLGCALYGASALAQTALQQSALVAAVAGAVIAELGGGKVGVAWNDPSRPMPSARRNVHHALFAFALGALVGALTLCIGFASKTLHQELQGRPLLVPLALGLMESFFFAIQIEILQRGVLRVFCKRTQLSAFVPLAILIGVAASAGQVGWNLPALTAAGSFSLAMALAWNRAGGALVPIFLHTGQRFVLTVLASGSGLGLVGRGPIGGARLDGGLAAAAAMLLFAVALALWPAAARDRVS